MESSQQHKVPKQREAGRPGKARRLSGVLRVLFVSAAAMSLAGACGDSTKEKQKAAQLAEGCLLNSDCTNPLACAFQRCHEQCETSRDCPTGQRCVLNEDDHHVCQLEDEIECEEDADCEGDQSCGVDAECRDECEKASDCVDDQACSYGSCADDEELTEDGELPIEPGHEPDGGSGGSAGQSGGGSGGTGGSSATGGSGGTGGVGGSTTTGAGGTSSGDCGNGIVDDGEECDDGATQPGDGCDANCDEESGWTCSGEPTECEDIDECSEGTAPCHADATCSNTDGDYECECNEGFVGDGLDCEDECAADPSSCSLPVVQVVTGQYHTCALFESGDVRCWGYGAYGATGYGNQDQVGDNELPTVDVNVGGKVVQLAAGGNHTCALLDNAKVRCWGEGGYGALGYGNTDNIGDTENPGFAGDVNVGGDVQQIATGTHHTCALLTTGAVRCWGYGAYGALGYGNTTTIGDTEDPADAGNVSLGGEATQIAVGQYRTCAVMDTGGVRCWGYGPYGALGLGDVNSVGDNELPSSVGEVQVGGEVSQVALGDHHTCALLTTGTVRCWGLGDNGQLGYGDTNEVGDGETPEYAGNVPLGAPVSSVACGSNRTCVVLEDGGVVCWGSNTYGELGQGNVVQIGDDETPDSLDPIVLGDTAESVSLGFYQTCALTTSANIRCWGYGAYGSLGYGNTTNIGDDENPSVAGPVELL